MDLQCERETDLLKLHENGRARPEQSANPRKLPFERAPPGVPHSGRDPFENEASDFDLQTYFDDLIWRNLEERRGTLGIARHYGEHFLPPDLHACFLASEDRFTA
jgi:hypothetical protein